MPSTSKKQHNLMAAVAKNPAFAKKVGIKQSVGEEFLKADKGRKFGLGGSATITRGGKGQINKQGTRAGSIYGEQKEVPNVNLNKYIGKKEGGMAKSDMKEDMKADIKQDKAIVKKAFKMHDAQEHKGGKGTDLSKLRKGGMAMKKMAKGGETMGPRSMKEDVEKGSNKLLKFGESAVQKRGHTKGKNLGDSGPTVAPKTVKMKKGGKVKRYDDGGEIEFETKTGPNKMISDETRRKAMEQANADIESEPARAMPPKSKGSSFASKAKKAGFTSSETGGGAALMTRKMAKGGSASSRADGCAQRGKTRGKMMCMGGKS